MGKKPEGLCCPRCLNRDPKYFYKGSKGWYCRRCVSFSRVMVEESLMPAVSEEIREGSQNYRLRYPLTPLQKSISRDIVNHMYDTDILLEAVCGAGKTEMMVMPIAACLKDKKKVCFAISRRQVVLELTMRFRAYFPEAKVTGICGGFTSVVDGDLIIATTHQLYRFYRTFDLLILDEPDAFPFYGDPVLHGIAQTSCKGHIVYLTATPDRHLKKRVAQGSLHHLKVYERPHKHPLPVPKIYTAPTCLLFVHLILWLKRHARHPCLVFVPSVHEAMTLAFFIRVFMKCAYITSHSNTRDEIIRRLKSRKKGVLVCTTVMERGVTVNEANIAVFHADSAVFNEAGLIQMAGRAGRSFTHPEGDVVFYCASKSRLAAHCRDKIKEANEKCTA